MDAKHIRQSSSVPLPATNHVAVELDVRASNLHVQGGAQGLMDAVFTYDPDEREAPIVEYDQGKLRVSEGEIEHRQHTTVGQWDMQFNNDMPLRLDVHMRSGDSILELDYLALMALTVVSRSGRVGLSLNGDFPALDEVGLRTTSGGLVADLDGSFPTLGEVVLDSTSGDVKAVFGGHYDTLRQLTIRKASGDVRLGLSGIYQSALQLDFESSSGNCALDLTGTWRADLTGTLTSASGDVTLRLPRAVGVMVAAQVRSGAVQVQGLRQEGYTYINESYGRSAVILQLNVSVSSGNVLLVCE